MSAATLYGAILLDLKQIVVMSRNRRARDITAREDLGRMASALLDVEALCRALDSQPDKKWSSDTIARAVRATITEAIARPSA